VAVLALLQLAVLVVFHLEHKLPMGLLELPESVVQVGQLTHLARWLLAVAAVVADTSAAVAVVLTLIQSESTAVVAVAVRVT
jgi:hypothetical protein